MQNTYKSIAEGSGEGRCRGGDWVGKYDGSDREWCEDKPERVVLGDRAR
jgi:hypothetical protein